MLPDRTAVATTTSEIYTCEENFVYEKEFVLDTSNLAPAEYKIQIVAFEPNGAGQQSRHDYVANAVDFCIYSKNQLHNFEWAGRAWGYYVLPLLEENKEMK